MEKTNSGKLTEAYKKDVGFESVLNSLNATLSSVQKEIFQHVETDQTTAHIIGAPRSGTTLLSQLMLSGIDIGYINNFIATFWKAPLYGIHLSKKLLGESYQSNLESDFGRTKNIFEPHEFGYFWKHHLQYTDHLQQTYNESHSIPWEQLKGILYQMCVAFQKPIVFKSFLYGFHLEEAVKQMPKSLFIHIERNLYQNAFSILKLRKKMFGNETTWASMKPSQYTFLKNENIYRQIIGQVRFLNYEYKKQLAKIPEANKMQIKYTDLCQQTDLCLQNIHHKIANFATLEPLLNYKKDPIKENIAAIPEPILEAFKKANDWLSENFPELKNQNA